MNLDLSKLGKCAAHGHFAGRACPFCDLARQAPAAPPQAPPPPAEDRSMWFNGPEKELHDLFERWLGYHEIEFVHCRTDQKSTIESGWEDFTCLKCGPDGITRACMVELKNRAGNLRKDQVEVIDRHRERNRPVLVTGNFREAADFVKAQLAIPPEPGTTARDSTPPAIS